MDLEQGTVVANRYRILRPLGRGGMGEVFAAENIRTGRPVAIKLLRQDSKSKSLAVARFRQEARAAGSINSDHVTQVLDVEEDTEHGVVLVFELLEGESLIDRLKRTGPIPFDELWPIIEQVWMGLADAHRAGIIHRDLKPSNVFLEHRPDGTTRVKILDFGISKVPKEAGGETLTEMGQSLGTFSFMPPEQIGKAKTVDHRADIYACCTLIYQSLTGQLPYAARNILVMVEMKSKTDARKLSEAMPGGVVDPRLEAFVACGLSRDVSQRFPTALDALNGWRELRPVGPPSGQPSSGQPSSSEKPASSTPPGGSRPRSQPPGRSSAQSSSASASIPRAPQPPQINTPLVETPARLPRVNQDPIESTGDETAATLAMPMPQHLKKNLAALASRQARGEPAAGGAVAVAPDAAAANGPRGTGTIPVNLSSIKLQQPQPTHPQAGAQPARSPAPGNEEPKKVGPGGTQPVKVAHVFDHLADAARAREAQRTAPAEEKPAGRQSRSDETDESRSGNLHYLSPAVQASLQRPGPAPSAPVANPVGTAGNAGASALAVGPSGLPRTYEEPSSNPSAEGELRTQVYRPQENAARRPSLEAGATTAPRERPPLEAARPAPVKPGRSVSLVVLMLLFLALGFVAVTVISVFFKPW